MKVFVKRYPEKGELPSVSKKYFTSHGYLDYSVKRNEWSDCDWLDVNPDWWLEEIELPSDEDVFNKSTFYNDLESFEQGANYILDLLKQK